MMACQEISLIGHCFLRYQTTQSNPDGSKPAGTLQDIDLVNDDPRTIAVEEGDDFSI